jgi:hypothetical protein
MILTLQSRSLTHGLTNLGLRSCWRDSDTIDGEDDNVFDHRVELGADASHEVEPDPYWATQRTWPGKISHVVEFRTGSNSIFASL